MLTIFSILTLNVHRRNFEDPNIENETALDLITWKQWISNALRKSHGIFGEGIEYTFLNQDSNLAYVKVGLNDKDIFSSAVSTYISNEDLVGCPLFATVLQETPDLGSLEAQEEDEIWLKKAIESDDEDKLCG